MTQINLKRMTDELCTLELIRAKLIVESDGRYLDVEKVIRSVKRFYAFIETEIARATYHNEANRKRLQDNIDLVVEAIRTMTDENKSINEQWNSIRIVRYKAGTGDWVLACAKKIIFTLCAAATGFILGAITGASVTGGISGIPIAIWTSIKAAAAIWGSAGAATVGLWPTFFGLILAKDQMAKETSSPVEREMLEVKKTLALKNKKDRFFSIEKKFNQLLAAGTDETEGVYPMLKAVIERADTLHQSSIKWYTVDYVSRRTKARELYQAVHQVLEQLTAPNAPSPDRLSWENILEFKVNINGEIKTFDQIINTRRHPWSDSLMGLFAHRVTETQSLAHEAYSTPKLG